MYYPPQSSGEEHGKKGADDGAYIKNAVNAIFIVGVVWFIIGLDLYLGPQFTGAYATSVGHPLSGLGLMIPWAFSVATTGLNYALWDRSEHGWRGLSLRRQITMLVAWALAIMDSILDAAGFLTIISHNPSVGAHIIPHGLPIWQVAPAVAVGVVCFFHEKALQKLLQRWEGNQSIYAGSPGYTMVERAFVISGYTLNWLKRFAIPGGVVCAILLDLIMTPNLAVGGSNSFMLWAGSFIITGIQILGWHNLDEVGIWRPNMPGYASLSKAEKRRARKEHHRQQLVLLVVWGIGILDTLGDMAGFTTAVYGHGQGFRLYPVHPTASFWVTVTMVLIFCFGSEALLSEILWRPEHAARAAEAGMSEGLGGFSGLGGMDGFGGPPLGAPTGHVGSGLDPSSGLAGTASLGGGDHSIHGEHDPGGPSGSVFDEFGD